MRIGIISSGVFAVGSGGGGSGAGGAALSGYGGLEVIAWTTAKGLAAKGHEVYLFAPEGSVCPGVTIIPIGPPGSWSEAQLYDKYWQYLLSFNDGGVLIDHSWSKQSYLLKLEGRLTAPILAVMHAPINTMISSTPPVEKPCFVCISEDQSLHLKGLHSVDARVAYNGIDMDLYKRLQIPKSNRFLFLARFSTIKGPDLAQDLCLATGNGLDLVGDHTITNEPEFLEQVKRKCDGKQIRMIGPCSRGNTVFWFSQARALTHLNMRFREPFGLAPCEAQACGCPVLAWNYGAMRETVKHGETGYLVNTMDKAIGLVKAGALDALDGNRCREWVSQFSEQNMINRYEELCKEAIDTGGW